jgi:uncharacterized protein DUF6496
MPSNEVMHKFKHGQLHSGSKKGPQVKNRKQALAIMLSEKRNEGQHGGTYKSGVDTGPSPQFRKKKGIK